MRAPQTQNSNCDNPRCEEAIAAGVCVSLIHPSTRGGCLTRMSRPHPSLAAVDSERTLILQRRSYSKSTHTNRRVSAYFDCSDTSGESRQEREVTARRSVCAGATSAAIASRGPSRTSGRWVLEGICRSQHGKLQTPDDEIPSNDAARVFYGSVRFPASRVALW